MHDTQAAATELTLGQLVREQRIAARLTQAALCERAGISTRALQDLERGTSQPHRDTVLRLGSALGLSAEAQAALSRAAGSTPRRTRSAEAELRPRIPEPERRSTLPLQLTGLIGRERELAQLETLLASSRLVCLTGAGGVGKTRLAIDAAARLGGGFADGVVFVDLAPVTDARAVPATVARTLGIRDDGELTLDQRLTNALRERQLLLVLDNFEHVLPAAGWVLELLRSALGVTVLVTSRAPLRVRGERELPVPPLACPAPGRDEPPDALLGYPALALFVERAQEVRPDFTLAPGSAASIAEICRRLDGLPLALELAAARIRVLSPEALLGRVGQGVGLLRGGPRDLPARQQTLAATIAWSYDLLDEAEQALFRRLSVFAGSFSLEAATHLAGATDSGSVFELVASMAEKNLLVQAEARGDEPRFRLLETVREFAFDQLESHAEVEAARRAHAEFFARFAETAAPHLRQAHRDAWLPRIDLEMDNLRAALSWSNERTDGGAALVRITRGLGFVFWRMHAGANEGLRWGELALATPAAEVAAERMWLLCEYGGIAAYLRKFALAREWLEASMRLADRSGNMALLGLALVYLGFAESHTAEPTAAQHLHEGISHIRLAGDLHELVFALDVATLPLLFGEDQPAAQATLAESIVGARELGDDWLMAVALSNAGYLDMKQRDWASALVHIEQALAMHLRLGDDGSVSILYNNLAVVLRNQGDDVRGRQLLDQSLAMERRSGQLSTITLSNLGTFALRQGDLLCARESFGQALGNSLATGELRAVDAALGGLSRLAAAVGQFEVAGRLYGATEALQERGSLDISEETRAALLEVSAQVRSAVGVEAFNAIAAGGRAAPLDQVTAEALAWVESAASMPPPALTGDRTSSTSTADGLSAREIEVLRLVAGGKSNREIAGALTISLNTVARHISNIFNKIGVTNRTEAAAYAHRVLNA